MHHDDEVIRFRLDPTFEGDLHDVLREQPWLRSRQARVAFLIDLGRRAFRQALATPNAQRGLWSPPPARPVEEGL